MAWNTPSDKKPEDKDPWTGRSKRANDGPPLLEDLVKHFFKRISGIKNPKNSNEKIPPKTWGISAIIFIILLWGVLGFYQVAANQEAFLFRLGQYQKTLDAGWHWRFWGIDHVLLFDRNEILSEILSTDVMSEDNNLARIEIKVAYHVNDPKNYYLNISDAKAFVKAAASMALQQTAASMPLDAALSDNKNSPFIQNLQQNISNTFDKISLGAQIDKVEILNVAVPPEVQETFNKIDALYTEQDKQKEKAADYEKQVLPPAQVKAEKLIADANAYAAQAKLKAQTEVADFLAILPAYQQAPGVTRYRLYSQAMEEILSKTTKVVVTSKNGNANVYVSTTPSQDTPAFTPQENTASAAATTDASASNEDSNEMYNEIKGGYS